jgi:hypothetical protein
MFARCLKVVAVTLLAASAAAPQDLAPEVLLLSRIKRHLRDELAHTPNFTCLETISRFRDSSPSGVQSHKGLAKMDTVQLEIVYADRREWYGSPGAHSLNVENPVAFIGSGMIGNGAFAIGLNNMVEGGIFTYRGEEPVSGRKAVRYDFRIPSLTKPLEITMYGGRGTVGEEGSVWVDPESLDPIRVESHAIEIPPYLPLLEATLNVDYARTRIADADALLAQEADSRMVDDRGIESYNRIEFTHCHSYSTSSAITFDSKPEPSTEAASTAPTAPALGSAVPAFLEITIVLTAPVSDKNSVGAMIEGKIAADVVHKGKVVVPGGSVVHGRIRTLDRYPDSGVFAVGLEFTDVEVRGESLPFYADLLRLDKDPRIQPELSRRVLVPGRSGVRLAGETITLPELPGVASFFVKGADFTLPAGFRVVWRTRGLLH